MSTVVEGEGAAKGVKRCVSGGCCTASRSQVFIVLKGAQKLLLWLGRFRRHCVQAQNSFGAGAMPSPMASVAGRDSTGPGNGAQWRGIHGKCKMGLCCSLCQN